MRWCDKCGDMMFADFGYCRCREMVIIDVDGDEHLLFANDEQDGALKHAQRSNENGDYYLMNETVEITVNGKPFCIGAEPDIHYSAKEL